MHAPMNRTTAELWMREALKEARKAQKEGEVPVGAVLVIDGKIAARGYNHCVRSHDPTAHAEILAMRRGSHRLRNYRLPGSLLVVTLEPCVMCAGAMIHARVDDLVYGASDPKAGAIQSHLRILDAPHLNHKVDVVSGILDGECGSLLRDFFEARR